jgi:hypothetical protein
MKHNAMRAVRLALCLLAGLAFVPGTAEAKITSVTVKTSGSHPGAAGYTSAEITIRGSVARPDGTEGRYTVPAVVLYPRHGRGNGIGVVDWLNTAVYHFFPPDTEFGTHQFTLYATGNHLFDEGYTYISVQWDKAVTEIFGGTPPEDGQPHNHLVYGSIERSADAWEILLDAARLLKNPRAFPRSDRPAPVATVLSSGYSQGGALQLEVLAEGLDPSRVYDGHLVQMIGLVCWKREDVAPRFGFLGECGPLPEDGNHAPVVVLTSESDMLVYHPTVLGVGKSGFFSRNQANPNWRQYEMAGVSHIPKPVLSLGVPDQNTGDPRPLFRAALHNLARWTHGRHRTQPPAPQYFEGGVDSTDAFIPTLDADGHFAGGVRLPHVASRVLGLAAGAPLGKHGPLNPASANPFVLLGGTFTRFGDEELRDRYPSRLLYVGRVARAALHLAARRYISGDDGRALIVAAVNEPLP